MYIGRHKIGQEITNVDMYFLGLGLHRVQKSVSFRIELIFVFSFYFIQSISIDLVIVSFHLA